MLSWLTFSSGMRVRHPCSTLAMLSLCILFSNLRACCGPVECVKGRGGGTGENHSRAAWPAPERVGGARGLGSTQHPLSRQQPCRHGLRYRLLGPLLQNDGGQGRNRCEGAEPTTITDREAANSRSTGDAWRSG
jgi:hypothetical protein